MQTDPFLQVPNAEPATPWRSLLLLALGYWAWTKRDAIRRSVKRVTG